jgi:hypothetical protein
MHKLLLVPSAQAELQHTPSVQKPLMHWSVLVQAAPLGLRPHELFTQVLGGAQSLSLWQVERHALFLQMKLPHGWSAGATHFPRPSQLAVGCRMEALAQLEVLHGVLSSK